MSSPDVVIPVRRDYRKAGMDPLRWCLRAITAHLAHGRVFIVGDLPKWADRDTVVHVATEQTGTKFENIGVNIRAAAELEELTDPFYWFNDDFFVLETMPSIELHHRHSMFHEVIDGLNGSTGSAEHRAYVVGMRRQLELLERWGFERPIPCTDMHVPIPLSRGRLLEVLDRARADDPELEGGHFRALYGAGLPSTELHDVKVRGARAELPAGPFVSTDPVSWEVGVIGKTLRRRYWRPSPYEVGR